RSWNRSGRVRCNEIASDNSRSARYFFAARPVDATRANALVIYFFQPQDQISNVQQAAIPQLCEYRFSSMIQAEEFGVSWIIISSLNLLRCYASIRQVFLHSAT